MKKGEKLNVVAQSVVSELSKTEQVGTWIESRLGGKKRSRFRWRMMAAGRKTRVKNHPYTGRREKENSQKPDVVVSLWRVMWRHLTYRVAKSGGKENPLMKPCPTNGCKVASSDVREYKIGISGGIKLRYLTYKSGAKSGFSLWGVQVGLPPRQCRREL